MVRLPEATLLIIGGDQDEPDNGHGALMREQVRALGLERRVRFLGAQPQRRLRLFYAAADATVMPSYYESFGMVALEAMACGSPVVASRVGGSRRRSRTASPATSSRRAIPSRWRRLATLLADDEAGAGSGARPSGGLPRPLALRRRERSASSTRRCGPPPFPI